MSRTERAKIAEQTVAILAAKQYRSHLGETVPIASALEACLAGTILLRPEEWEDLLARVREKLKAFPPSKPVEISILDETTFGTCRRWVTQLELTEVACLNFASAKNPGGGFLGGSQAQEEALSRASGLYASLLTQQGYYDFNRKVGTCLYSDHMIWSPAVPVFRDDKDQLLEHPYCVSIITAPAVNAGCIRQNEPHKADEIQKVMADRAEKVLALALNQGVKNLVLGAWGCGVFANDPAEIAAIFAHLLRPNGAFGRAFSRVAFSIPSGGSSRENWLAFSETEWK
jgi:uncharacterized protein (TIGR02452 family)